MSVQTREAPIAVQPNTERAPARVDPARRTARPVEEAAIEKRVRDNSKRVRDLDAKIRRARAARDAAVVSLHFHDGWAPVKCYRLIGVSRGLFVRMTTRAKNAAESTGVGLARVEKAEQVAKRAARDLARYEAARDYARDARDADADAMLNGRALTPDGTVYRNAELARLTGLTTARVAQLRHGGR